MRFRSRHVQQTISDYLVAGITELGWINEPRIFGLDAPVRVIDVDPDQITSDDPEEIRELRSRLDGVTMAINVEEEDEDLIAELGGPLYRVAMPMSVDVWADLASIATSLASDVKSLLRDAHIPVRDYANGGTPVEGSYIEPEMVRISRPPGNVIGIDFKKRWRIVGFDARVWFVTGATGISSSDHQGGY